MMQTSLAVGLAVEVEDASEARFLLSVAPQVTSFHLVLSSPVPSWHLRAKPERVRN